MIDVVIHVGGRLAWQIDRFMYLGGRKIICRNRDPDIMNLLELFRGLRFLGYRNIGEITCSADDDMHEDLVLLLTDADLNYVCNKVGLGKSLHVFVNHTNDDRADPICDGYTNSYLINDTIGNWEEVTDSVTVGQQELEEDEIHDDGSKSIPSDIGSGEDQEYEPNESKSDSSESSQDVDLSCEPSEHFSAIRELDTEQDSEYIQSPPDSDEEGGKKKLKYKYWNPETDYERPIKIEIGLVFHDSKEFKMCLREYGIQNGFSYKLKCNEKDRIVAWCISNSCGWKIRASYSPDSHGITVKTLKEPHSCPRIHKNNKVTSAWMAKKILNMVRADIDWKIDGIRNHIKEKFHVDVSNQQCYRAKRLALATVQGEEKGQYKRLRDYCRALKEWNPGSSAIIHSPNLVFARMYICLEACKKGFMAGCRPLIALDGCHLKTAYKGQLLCAIGKDGNENMFPVAFAVVEIENGETWKWFLHMLMNDLGGFEGRKYTFITDQQKGLVGAVKEYADEQHHRFCLRHLYANFKGKFKGRVLKHVLWKAAVATTDKWFREAMNEMKSLDEAAYNWLNEKDPRQWSKHKFNTEVKTDLIMNNIAESFNSWVLDARSKPIRTMCEQIRSQLMRRIVTRRSDLRSRHFSGKLCPRIQGKVNDSKRYRADYIVNYDGEKMYEVQTSGDTRFLVNLDEHTCSCRRWDLTGIPCRHGVAAIIHARRAPEDFVDSYYHVSTYAKAYNYTIHAMPGADEWEHGPEPDIEPPESIPQPGRKKKVRRREIDEVPTAFHLKRCGGRLKCGKCNGVGHNARTCKQETTNEAQMAKKRKEAERVKKYRQKKKHEASQPKRTQMTTRSTAQSYSQPPPTHGSTILPPTSRGQSSSQPLQASP